MKKYSGDSNICTPLDQTATYVAAAETCPLLVRWAPKCICMHLSRQQRSGWKQNRTQKDTCSWASSLVVTKGSVCWTDEYCHLRMPSSYFSREVRFLPLVQTWAFPLRSAARRDSAISIQSRDAQQLHSRDLNWRAANRAATVLTRLFRVIQRIRARLGLQHNSRSKSARLYLQAVVSAMCLDLHWCKGTCIHPYTTAAGGVGFHQLPTRDITDIVLACVHQWPLSTSLLS